MPTPIEIKYPKTMRYETAGDYFYKPDGTLRFELIDLGDEFFNRLLLFHEMGEQLLTETRGISEQEIKRFDDEHKNSSDPGMEKDAPYRDEHLFMEGIERLICAKAVRSWLDYEEALNLAFKNNFG